MLSFANGSDDFVFRRYGSGNAGTTSIGMDCGRMATILSRALSARGIIVRQGFKDKFASVLEKFVSPLDRMTVSAGVSTNLRMPGENSWFRQ